MSGTNLGSNVGKQEMEKRKRTLTEKALGNKIESIQKERKKKVDEITTLITYIKELMKDEKNVSLVREQLDVLTQCSEISNTLHESLMPLIPEDEQERQNEWFSKVNKYKNGFIQDVDAWFFITRGN